MKMASLETIGGRDSFGEEEWREGGAGGGGGGGRVEGKWDINETLERGPFSSAQPWIKDKTDSLRASFRWKDKSSQNFERMDELDA